MQILTSPLPWIALGALGCLIVADGLGAREVIKNIRKLAQLTVLVGLAIAGLSAFPLMFWPIPAPLQPALLAALVVVAGWMVTFLFQEMARRRDQIDLMLALRAEIYVVRSQIDPRITQQFREAVAASFDQALADGRDYRPFVTMPADATVFEGLRGQIARLPSDVVDDVIQFYSLLSDLRVFAKDLREAHFQALPNARARQAYDDFYETRLALAGFADVAIASLNKASGVRPVDSPVEDQSGPKSGAGVSEHSS